MEENSFVMGPAEHLLLRFTLSQRKQELFPFEITLMATTGDSHLGGSRNLANSISNLFPVTFCPWAHVTLPMPRFSPLAKKAIEGTYYPQRVD